MFFPACSILWVSKKCNSLIYILLKVSKAKLIIKTEWCMCFCRLFLLISSIFVPISSLLFSFMYIFFILYRDWNNSWSMYISSQILLMFFQNSLFLKRIWGIFFIGIRLRCVEIILCISGTFLQRKIVQI